ncbi:hypothetical protein Cadr_000030565 [Camelus dromedarius]|uniref:Uncharacterized protein n=1 Tax=Camelus dromedarius TaxID=9838 RepID=A0A5N4BXF2_CAMDR|nr:hypothetical protein Cadr_000030565 [Camelus dromedarius]
MESSGPAVPGKGAGGVRPGATLCPPRSTGVLFRPRAPSAGVVRCDFLQAKQKSILSPGLFGKCPERPLTLLPPTCAPGPGSVSSWPTIPTSPCPPPPPACPPPPPACPPPPPPCPPPPPPCPPLPLLALLPHLRALLLPLHCSPSSGPSSVQCSQLAQLSQPRIDRPPHQAAPTCRCHRTL